MIVKVFDAFDNPSVIHVVLHAEIDMRSRLTRSRGRVMVDYPLGDYVPP